MLATTATAVLAASLLTAPPAQAAPSCHGETATIVGTKRADQLRGTPGRDVIVGRGGGDDIRGRGGDDLICGNIGADTLRGGPGEDLLLGGWDRQTFERTGYHLFGDTFRGGPGDDEIRPGADPREGQDFGRRDQLVYAGAPVGVTVDAVAGTVVGRDGTDTFAVGGLVQVVGSQHDDSMAGGPGSDVFLGLAGDDRLLGRGGRDRLHAENLESQGPRDRDVLHGGGGHDRLWTGPGRDRSSGGSGADYIFEDGPGSDRLYGNRGGDYITDSIRHGRRHVLDGGPGRDRLDLGSVPGTSGRMDLRSGATRLRTQPRATLAKVRDVEIVRLLNGRWVFHGSRADEELEFFSQGRLTAYMHGGNDRIFGGDRRDAYAGGRGRDRLSDPGGIDRCRSIEVERDRSDCNRVWR
jgi:Ca2+-binding RTX toxin-like protein